jgi:serine/threonine protein kinase
MKTLGKYVVEEEIAKGGQGTVFRVKDQNGKTFLLKLCARVEFTARARQEAQFGRDSRIADDPAFLPCVDEGEDAERRYYAVFPFIQDAQTLDSWLTQRTHFVERICAMGCAARAVARCHAKKIIHRDIKPANFLRDAQGRVYLIDFGLAKDLSQEVKNDAVVTIVGDAFGTASHIAPEQMEDAASATAAADVYSLGVMLFQALCGVHPYEDVLPKTSKDLAAFKKRLSSGDLAIDWKRIGGSDSSELASLCRRSLERDPRERPTAAELDLTLARWLIEAYETARTTIHLSREQVTEKSHGATQHAGNIRPARASWVPYLAGALAITCLVSLILAKAEYDRRKLDVGITAVTSTMKSFDERIARLGHMPDDLAAIKSALAAREVDELRTLEIEVVRVDLENADLNNINPQLHKIALTSSAVAGSSFVGFDLPLESKRVGPYNPPQQARRFTVPLRDGQLVFRGTLFVGTSTTYPAGLDTAEVKWAFRESLYHDLQPLKFENTGRSAPTVFLRVCRPSR